MLYPRLDYDAGLIDEANIRIDTIRDVTVPKSPPWELEPPNNYLAPIGGGRGIVMPMSVCLCVCLCVCPCFRKISKCNISAILGQRSRS